jgi:hypothetical protein
MKPPRIDLVVTIDRPRVLRINASSVAHFEKISGTRFGAAITSMTPDHDRDMLLLSKMVFAFAREADPTVCAADVILHMTRDVVTRLAERFAALQHQLRRPGSVGRN